LAILPVMQAFQCQTNLAHNQPEILQEQMVPAMRVS
jgi:hypothetical protein